MKEPRPGRRSLRRFMRNKWVWATASVPLIIAGICGWLTAPLEPPSPSSGSVTVPSRPHAAPVGLPEWPNRAMSGPGATELLLTSLLDAKARLQAAGGYTAVLRKLERIGGSLGDEQVMEMKARLDPFAMYLKYRVPETGKEVVFARGRYDDQVVAHGVGLSRRFIPRIKVPPDSAIALLGNRHPITDAGLGNLTDKLIYYRRMDQGDSGAETTLDRFRDDDGREWLRSVHTHADPKADRPFARVEVLYDRDTRIPLRIANYDWPANGDEGDFKLAERYEYDDLVLAPPLSDLDFDPANPVYDF